MKGNAAIVKPSELSPSTAKMFAQLLPKYLDTDCYNVVLGDAEDTKQLLTQKFDYIFFTGSNRVGRYIHQSAAQNLTPTTLELAEKVHSILTTRYPIWKWRGVEYFGAK